MATKGQDVYMETSAHPFAERRDLERAGETGRWRRGRREGPRELERKKE